MARDYGLNKAIHIDEYFALHPDHFASMARRSFPVDRMEKARRAVVSRFGESITSFDIKFEAIMLMSDADFLEINLQLMSDLILSKQGSIRERRSKQDK